MARVITYGYESAVANSSSMQNLEDIATSFRESLDTLMSSRSARPLIFIAHSLGGLIVKQALITLAQSKEEAHKRIIRAVYGIVFFGVPHDGMDIGSLIPMVKDGPNRELIGSISRINSQILSIQQRDFHKALGPEGHTEVFCFYETTESPTALQDENGRWRMAGPKAVLVAKSSATHCRPWEDGPEHICAINRSHSDMVKFGQEDHEYEQTLQRLRGLAKRALGVQRRLRDNSTKYYIGRSLILEKIKEQFGYSKSQAARQPRVSLFGLGGIGKTQIALAFTYWIYDNLLDTSVFWVHASSADRFRQAFTSIAEECQVPGWDDPKSDVPMLVRRWLEKRERGRWAMIIDNADNSELFFPSKSEQADTAAANSATTSNRLSDYLPDCTHGSILITTRDKKTAVRFLQGKSPLVEVDKMSESEAGRLLHKTLGDRIPAEEAACLFARLEYLPLAIAQAAAFIQENSISTDEYLQILDENEDTFVEQLNEPFETVGRDSDTPNAVTATWIVSFNQIQRQDILASEILSFISLLDRQAIPKSFIMSYCDESCKSVQQTSIAGVTKALGTLKAFSLVAETKDNTIDMHRLVQLVTRKWLVMQDKFAEFAERALKTVSEAYPYGRHETRQACVDYLPHAIAVLGNNETGFGQWKEAELSAVQSVNIRQEVLGEEDPDTLISMSNLAVTYRNQGRWEESEKLEVKVMEMCKQKLGPTHPDTLTSMANLAFTWYSQKRITDALDLMDSCVQIRLEVLGTEHPDTSSSIKALENWRAEQVIPPLTDLG
ncbi:hypothetical protein J7T55_011355 [Diaporthe amygdali]|uniref:uncharacterized protein n=1 Tax=Phomopsis amygdali TaxID=1214568 RepID=UPI0022FDFCC0|nr:uncharacterized protein J7T55_011355 [Diaporthe amygdali]KAJ0108861.1 hypothetical protein J7T55_011355 [Diaporthe amygdali]